MSNVSNLRQKFESQQPNPSSPRYKPDKPPLKPKQPVKQESINQPLKNPDKPPLKPKPRVKQEPTSQPLNNLKPSSITSEDPESKDQNQIIDGKRFDRNDSPELVIGTDNEKPLHLDGMTREPERHLKPSSITSEEPESKDQNQIIDGKEFDRNDSPEMVIGTDNEKPLHLDKTREPERNDTNLRKENEKEEPVPLPDNQEYENQIVHNLTTNEGNKEGDDLSKIFQAVQKDVKQMTTTFKTHANNQELLQDNNNQFGDNMVMNNGHNEEGNLLRTEKLGENLDRPEIPVVSKKKVHTEKEAEEPVVQTVQDQSDSNNQFDHNMTLNKGNKEEEGQLRTKHVEENLDVPKILETSKKNLNRNPPIFNTETDDFDALQEKQDNMNQFDSKPFTDEDEKGDGHLRSKQRGEKTEIVHGYTPEILVAAPQVKMLETDMQSVSSERSSSSRSSPSGNADDHKFDSGLSAGDSDEETVIETKDTSLDQIEYMIKIYMPFIKHQIKVTDIIEHLHFISDRERDIILSKNKSCASDAFERLVSVIKNSACPGKWRTFLEALELKGFKYIKDLIEGKTEVHHDSNRNLLRLVTPDLVNRLDARPFLDHAYEKELLTDDDKSEIDAELQNHGENKAISVTLERVVKYKEDWNRILIDIFKQEEFCLWDIADLFEFIMQSKPEVSIKGVTKISHKRQTSVKKVLEWQEQYHVGRAASSSTDSEKDSTETLESIRTGQAISFEMPTRQDFVDLKSEMRELRKMLIRLEARL